MINISTQDLKKYIYNQVEKKTIEKARNDLFTLTNYAMRYLEGIDLVSKWHVQYLCEILQAVHKKQLGKVNIIIPPGHTKTFLLTRGFIPYMLGHDPKARIIYTRRKEELAATETGLAKKIILSSQYQKMFPSIKLDKKGDSKFTIHNNRGFVLAKGIETSVTGESADLMIFDDILDAGDSVIESEKIYNNLSKGFFNRLRDGKEKNYGYVFINQRLNTYDTTAFLKDNYNFEEFYIPCIETQERTYSFNSFSYHRPVGELLNPEITTKEKIKEKIGDFEVYDNAKRIFETQYQGRPEIIGGQIIKGEWFQYYDTYLDKRFDRIFITADTATDTKKHNDYSVACVWGMLNGNLYLLDMIRDKWEAPELYKNFSNFWNKWHRGVNSISCTGFYIEKASSGISMIQHFKRHLPVVFEIERQANKLTRLYAVADSIQAGRVFLPQDRKISGLLISECEQFTRNDTHQHDDIIDCLIDAIQLGITNIKTSWMFL
jgi:predicted phage terminase large subunit-like protein